ncbi:helix-turn-helix domain-containing protein [Mesorhizobium sp. LHD-90]|uniref:TetR/AcrR family transcriptional regulator n=1 Tax=Mesorhizobium sp. LHD-90 TaxID=3071414 RepID=UPI0027DF85D8|nr:helix-turn-helix domain-containing protein [Mesorhizobium sp. LHD-90]MDQ6433671.1 helix-turn-helix domain-containing protein [Mesorhizobium sp. LHD-90]
MTSAELSTRDRIVNAASDLFYGEGIRAVSVDAVAERAGVTKRTLYYHFTSKDELIAAYLQQREQPNLARFRRWYAEAEGGVAEKTRAVFRNLARAARRPSWRGCAFLRTAAELANMPGHPAIRIGVAHKKDFENWFAAMFAAEGLENPAQLARQVVILLDGAFAVVLLNRDPAYMEAAGDAAFTLVTGAPAQR